MDTRKMHLAAKPGYAEQSRAISQSLALAQPPVAVCFLQSAPAGVSEFSGRVAAGCRFWQDAAESSFSTTAKDHGNCAVGVYTHNLEAPAQFQSDLQGALQMFEDLGYLRKQDIASVPVLASRSPFVVYTPLADAPQVPDVVLLFVNARQSLILSEAAQQVDGGSPLAMGRPACAVIPQVTNSGMAAFSFGCCGARAYLDVMKDETAIFAMPGKKLDLYVERIAGLAQANATLSRFHQERRATVDA